MLFSSNVSLQSRARTVIVLIGVLLSVLIPVGATAQPVFSPVTWQDAVDLTVTGSSVTKNAGCDGCSNAHAVSSLQNGAQDIYLQFPAVLASHVRVGFVPDGVGVAAANLAYSVGFWPDGGWDVREADTYKAGSSSAAANATGDVFAIAIEGTTVSYYRNGTLVFTGARAVGVSYRAALIVYSTGATLSSAQLAINVAPSMPTLQNRVVDIGAPFAIGVNATDPEHHALTYSATNLPAGLSIDPTTGVISGAPSATGSFHVGLTVNDGQGGTASGSFTIDVTSMRIFSAVTWEGVVGLTVNGSSAIKSSGCEGCPDAYAIGTAATGTQDTYLDFPATIGQHIVIGFIPEGATPTAANIAYSVVFRDENVWEVREQNVYRAGSAALGDILATDVFRIALEGSVVRYYRNGNLVYSGTRAAGISYRPVVLAFSLGATLKAAGVAINNAPSIGSIADQTVDVGAPVSIPIPATDPEGNTLTYTAAGLPNGLSINPAGLVSGSPTAAGTAIVSVGVTDGHGGSASVSFNLTVGTPSTGPVTIDTISPPSGAAGTQVTLSGSNFGTAQNGGSVLLGTRQASVVNWSNTVITATVPSGSTTGTAQVRRVSATSNTLPFTVVTPEIATVTPAGAPAGTAITITGSGFGSAQDTGGVWLGSAAVTITSWSDTQVQVTVPAGTGSGSLQVLQGGVLSNGVAFVVTGGAPHIDGIYPTSGAPGTLVYIFGSGFGDLRGSGVVRLGGADMTMTSWSETLVQATVSPTAVSGVIKLQQDALWSNGRSFTVQTENGSSITLSPNLANLIVSQSRSVQALDQHGAPVAGLTWSSSDETIVTVSTDPSPLITAVAPGTALIRAGEASMDVTVHAQGAMPEGTVLWSVPGPASDVADIKVAVPAEGAVADVFAIGGDGAVQAIGADGTVAWTAPSPSLGWNSDSRPDFQGGLVVFNSDTIVRLHPATGQSTTLYSNANDETQSYGLAVPAIHPDGKVLTVDYTCHDFCDGADPDDSAAVVGIDVASGTRAFRVPLVNTSYTFTTQDAEFCRNSAGNGTSTWQSHAWPNNRLTMAADGFAYLSYLTYHSTGTWQRAAQQAYPDTAFDLFDQMRGHVNAYQRDWDAALSTLDQLVVAINEPSNSRAYFLRGALNAHDYQSAFQYMNAWDPEFQRACDSSETLVTKMHLMRVNGEGATSDVVVKEWPATQQVTYTLNPSSLTYTSSVLHTGPNNIDVSEHIITNADQGALFSWRATTQCYANSTNGPRTYIQVDPCPVTENHLTGVRANGTVASDTTWNPATDLYSAPEPILQLADDSFVGSIETSAGTAMIAFDATGHLKWTVPGVSPILATADDTILASGADGTTEFNLGGSAIRQHRDIGIQSWDANVYRLGSVEEVLTRPVVSAATFSPQRGGSPSAIGPKIFTTSDLAASAALKLTWNSTAESGLEYGGLICRSGTNRYYAGVVVTDGYSGSVDVWRSAVAKCRPESTTVGDFHTHPINFGQPYPSGTKVGTALPTDINNANLRPEITYYLMSPPLRAGGTAKCPVVGCIASENAPARSFYRWQGSTSIPNNALNNLWLKLPTAMGDPYQNRGWVFFPRQ